MKNGGEENEVRGTVVIGLKNTAFFFFKTKPSRSDVLDLDPTRVRPSSSRLGRVLIHWYNLFFSISECSILIFLHLLVVMFARVGETSLYSITPGPCIFFL